MDREANIMLVYSSTIAECEKPNRIEFSIHRVIILNGKTLNGRPQNRRIWSLNRPNSTSRSEIFNHLPIGVLEIEAVLILNSHIYRILGYEDSCPF